MLALEKFHAAMREHSKAEDLFDEKRRALLAAGMRVEAAREAMRRAVEQKLETA